MTVTTGMKRFEDSIGGRNGSHAKLTKYKGDFWAPYYADEMRIENFKLAHFMQEKFGIFSSDGSTYHHLAEDRDWTLRNFKLAAKRITEATKKMEEAE
jgi:hypothetical protein